MDEYKKAYCENWESEIEKLEKQFSRDSDLEVAKELAAEIRSGDTWDSDLLSQLCKLAGMSEEWRTATGETFESVAYAAAEKLGVEI